MNATSNKVLDAAREYVDQLGFSVICVPEDSKKATIRWKPYQSQTPSSDQLARMFAAPSNLAIVLGEVSGGLACRDFDKAEPYIAFKLMFPRLAYAMPTTETASGKRHCYFRLSPSAKADYADKSYLKIGDDEGELRLQNCYCVAPPSRIGKGEYRWIIEGEFPEIDPRDFFLDRAFADLPFEPERSKALQLRDQLILASDKRSCPIGEGGRDADDWEFLWKLAVLEINRIIPESIAADALAAVKDEKPAKRIAFLRKAVVLRCQTLQIDLHKLLTQVELPKILPPSPKLLKNRTEPSKCMQHKKAQEDPGGAGNLGSTGNSRTSRDAGHEERGGEIAKINLDTPKLLPYGGPVLRFGEMPKDLEDAIEVAFRATLPTGLKQRESALMNLARRLKGIPECAPLESWAFLDLLREWHRRVIDKIGTKPFSESWSDFVRAYMRVRKPYGRDLNDALETARSAPMPVCVSHHDSPSIVDLARLCKVLQSRTNGQPFFLSCQALGDLFGVDKSTAWRWIGTGRDEGWLLEVSKGQMKARRASEYFYLGD